MPGTKPAELPACGEGCEPGVPSPPPSGHPDLPNPCCRQRDDKTMGRRWFRGTDFSLTLGAFGKNIQGTRLNAALACSSVVAERCTAQHETPQVVVSDRG